MKRDKLEIIRSILLICKNDDTKKTKIVYKANLNFKSADVYLKLLIDQKMIKKEICPSRPRLKELNYYPI